MKLRKALVICLALSVFCTAFAGCGKQTTESDTSAIVSEDDDNIYVNLETDNTSEGSTSGGSNSGTGNSGTGNSGTGNLGTGNSGTGNSGTGNSGTGNSGTGNSGITGKTDTNVFDNMPASLRGTTVKFAQWGDEGSTHYRELMKKFTQKYGIQVEWVTYNEGEYASKIISQIAAGSSPDIVICNGTFPTAVGMAQELPSYFNLNDGFWDKRVSEDLSVDGKYYFTNAINSIIINQSALIFNRNVFAKTGVTTPEEYYEQGKWTWENLQKCCENLVKAGYKGILLSMSSCTLARQMGVPFISYDPSTGKFKNNATNQTFVDAFTYEQSLIDKKLASREHSQNFLGGEYGMIFFGDFDLKANGRLKEMAPSEIGAVPLPTSYKGQTLEYNLGGGRGYGVARGSKNPEGAYYVLRYYLDVNNYLAEGVNVFANKALEGYYVNTMLPLYKAANKRSIDFVKQPCLLIDKYFDSTREPWVDMLAASSDQAATELKKVSGLFDSAVSAADKALAEYK